MRTQAITTLVTVAALMLFGCNSGRLSTQTAVAEEATHVAVSSAKTYFLIIGKGKIIDPQKQQERAITAVQRIAKAARSSHAEAIIDSLAEQIMTKEQYRRSEVNEKVNGAIFRERLKQLASTAKAQDTVIIYTHSHGRKDDFEESQPLGGIVMDLPVRKLEHRGTILWDEYADLLLKIPAKNVVVLTMSCYSGGLVEHLNSPRVKERWKDRRWKEGRCFIVLTSQNKNLISSPIVKDGELINPFTRAVARAFSGEADGFELSSAKTTTPRHKDGKLTAGELIDYILHTTENTISEAPRRTNIAKPQLTGSFEREDVLLVSDKVADNDHEDRNTAQPDAAADADKPRR